MFPTIITPAVMMSIGILRDIDFSLSGSKFGRGSRPVGQSCQESADSM
jgi:hypothetical protein